MSFNFFLNYIHRQLVFIMLLCFINFSWAQKLPDVCFDNQNDYSFMWWKKTIKTGNQIFAIKTNKYALSFDYANLSIEDFSINKNNVAEEVVLKETNEESFPLNNPVKLRFGISNSNSITWCETTSGIDDDCQLVETGKYFQRRFLTNLPELNGFSKYDSGLEISSWPDRIAFILKGTPIENIKNLGLLTELTFDKKYAELIQYGDVKALKNPKDGSGFIIMKSSEATSIQVSETTVSVNYKPSRASHAGEEINVGMIIYPIAEDIDSKLKDIADLENKPLYVTAKQIAPKEAVLDVVYNKNKGWHQVKLRSDRTSGKSNTKDSINNRMERVLFTVNNPSNKDKVVRLNFAKGRLTLDGAKVFGVSGLSAVIRDLKGNPIGIPVQLSKNWHTGRSGRSNQYFRGSWYHGLSMLTIPANSKITLEYTSVNAMWGGVPAASHAQLCLIGWGANQQWDQSAIGSWGENITYEPDLDQAGAPVLDFRPLMVKSETGKKWGWTGNLGGADILNYTKTDGNRGWHSRIRTQYKSYSPNLTEVTYAGIMDDNSMDFEYTASLGRSDDMVRGLYKIKLKVLKDVSFKDFVVFQLGALNYHFANSKTLAWGNETGLKREWQATTGGNSRYITYKKIADGKVPWFSFTNTEFTVPWAKFTPANRGFIIRKWDAKINGKENTPPYFAEFNTTSGKHGRVSSIVNITAPDICTSFNAGDYIEAEIELMVLPSTAGEYYGPNTNFAKALQTKANSWDMMLREAVGNNIVVSVAKGELENNYPIKIESIKNKAQFSVTGGMGYVPLTITNVGRYQNPELFKKVNGKWRKINQEVYGNDFWQSEYNPETKTWDITYNINLDTSNDERKMVEFKFDNLN